MTKTELNKKIAELAKKRFYMPRSGDGNIPLEEIVTLCEPYLKEHPRDTDIWIKLALAVYTPPVADEMKAIEYMNKILKYDPLSPYALIALSYMEYNSWHSLTDTTFEKLCLVQVDDNKVMSMIERVKAWYYSEHNNRELYQKALENSVALCQDYVSNLISLGGLYMQQGKAEEGERLTALGLHNLQLKRARYEKNKYFDVTDINHFLEERIQ